MVRTLNRKNDMVLFVYELELHSVLRENTAGGLRTVRSTEKLCREE